MPPPRIVSLIASATEIVCALGYREHLVGISHECDFPHDIRGLPVCSAARVNVHASSREIDRQVKESLAQAVSVYDVRADVLQGLAPTHIITQTQCEVCAVSLHDVEQALCGMIESRPQIVALEPMCLADIWTDIRKVAASLGDPARGDRLISELKARLAAVTASVQRTERRPMVVCLEWIDPLMSAGNWMPELVEIAGGSALLGEAGKHSPWMTWDDLIAADPDVLVILPCGFDMPRTLSELGPLTEHPHWRTLRCVREGRVYITDGNQYFNRPGPRVVESAEILADILHGVARHRHYGTGWITLDADPTVGPLPAGERDSIAS
jgi:iron complex transport system substrate-binding protein